MKRKNEMLSENERTAGCAMHKDRSAAEINESLCVRLQTGDTEAAALLCRCNEGLVMKCAMGFYGARGNDLDLEDLMQEGYIGLLYAAKRFRPELGYCFSTYATNWVRQRIQRAVQETGYTVRMPVYLLESISKAVQLSTEYEARGFSDEEVLQRVAEAMGLRKEKVSELLETACRLHKISSLDLPLGDEDSATLGDLLPDRRQLPVEEQAAEDEVRDTLQEALNRLTERERLVLSLRYGLQNGVPHTLEQIAQVVGVTRERVRQIEKVARAKLAGQPSLQALVA